MPTWCKELVFTSHFVHYLVHSPITWLLTVYLSYLSTSMENVY